MPAADFAAAAAQVAAESPPLDDWHAGVGAQPARDELRAIRRAGGWPERVETIRVVYADDRRGYAVTRAVDQEVVVVPESWLRRYAELVGRRWAAVCRRRVDPRADR